LPRPRLGVVHGDVGVLDQAAHLEGVVGIEADADAGGGALLETVDEVGLRNRPDQLFGDMGGIRGGVDAGQYDDELVAAQAGDDVAVAHRSGQALRHLDEQLIAHMVAEGVVDDLEAIEVDQHQRQLLLVALAEAQRLFEALVQAEPVGQVGERVVVGEVTVFFLGGLALGDVDETADVMADLAATIAHGGDGQPFGIGLAGLAPVPQLALPAAALQDPFPHLLVDRFRGHARGEDLGVLADHLFGLVSGQAGEGRVCGDDAVACVGDDDGLGAVGKHHGHELHFVLAALVGADVAEGGGIQRPVRGLDQADRQADRKTATVAGHRPEFAHLAEPRGVVGSGVQGDQDVEALADQFVAGVVEQGLGVAVDQADAPVRVGDHHGVRRRFDQGVELALAFGQLVDVELGAEKQGVIAADDMAAQAEQGAVTGVQVEPATGTGFAFRLGQQFGKAWSHEYGGGISGRLAGLHAQQGQEAGVGIENFAVGGKTGHSNCPAVTQQGRNRRGAEASAEGIIAWWTQSRASLGGPRSDTWRRIWGGWRAAGWG